MTSRNLPATKKTGAMATINRYVEEFTDEDLQAQSKSDASVGVRRSYFRTKEKNKVRLCPKRPGSSIMYKECYRHGVMGVKGEKFIAFSCVGKQRPAGRCYVCEVAEAAIASSQDALEKAKARAAKSKGNKALDAEVKALDGEVKAAEMLQSRWGAYWNVIDMEEPEAGAKVAFFSSTIHRSIKQQTGLNTNDVQFRPWSVVDGFPIGINKAPPPVHYEVTLRPKDTEQLDEECYAGMADLEAEAAPKTPKECFEIAYELAVKWGVLKQMEWDEELQRWGFAAAEDDGTEEVEEEEAYTPPSKRVIDVEPTVTKPKKAAPVKVEEDDAWE